MNVLLNQAQLHGVVRKTHKETDMWKQNPHKRQVNEILPWKQEQRVICVGVWVGWQCYIRNVTDLYQICGIIIYQQKIEMSCRIERKKEKVKITVLKPKVQCMLPALSCLCTPSTFILSLYIHCMYFKNTFAAHNSYRP